MVLGSLSRACSCCLLLGLASGVAHGQGGVVFLMEGVPAAPADQPGDGTAMTTIGGTQILISGWVDDVPGSMNGYDMAFPCSIESDKTGAAQLTYAESSLTVDQTNADYVLYGLYPPPAGVEPGQCETIPCLENLDCRANSASSTCDDDNFCTMVTPFGGSLTFGAPLSVPDPKYLIEVWYDVPTDAAGTYWLELACPAAGPDCPAELTHLLNIMGATLPDVTYYGMEIFVQQGSCCVEMDCFDDHTQYSCDQMGGLLRPETPCPPTGPACPCEQDDDCDDGNECTDDICDANVCTYPNLPVQTACTGDGNECTADQCDGAGTCAHPSEPVGTVCGDPADTDCTDPDTCDDVGNCSTNDDDAGTQCTGDGNECTTDECDGNGACNHPNEPGGTACSDDGNECTADECNGGGACTHPNLDDGTPCTVDSDDCTADVCLAGSCEHPCSPETACDDGNPCTDDDICFDDGEGCYCEGVPNPSCNETCLDAVPVFEGSTEGSNESAMLEDDAEASCQPESNHDVWFFFDPTCHGEVFISASAVDPADFDSVLSVFSACGGVEIACDDDSGVGLDAALTYYAFAGSQYKIRVAGFQEQVGTFELTIATVNDCLIDGVCYADGALSPENHCLACIPQVSTSEWSPRSEGSSCGDPRGDEFNECDNPDACDGNGVCEPNFKPAQTPCGDYDDSQCDHPDTCDGEGACLDNFETDGLTCDDEDNCTDADVCLLGTCLGTPIPEAPDVAVTGPRALNVTAQPPGSSAPVALLVTSPVWPCLSKYVDFDGSLTDAPVFRLPAAWNTVMVRDADIIPGTPYAVQAECGVYLSSAGTNTTWRWGDVNSSGEVDIDDIMCMLDGFTFDFSTCSLENLDMAPCTPDGAIDIDDVLAILDAFANLPYRCAEPCS